MLINIIYGVDLQTVMEFHMKLDKLSRRQCSETRHVGLIVLVVRQIWTRQIVRWDGQNVQCGTC